VNGGHKIGQRHRDRLALVYLRQSMAAQAREHAESTMRQYALADSAAGLGWDRSQVLVLDGDLGLSGRSTRLRSDFKEVAGKVCQGEAGLVLVLEASRLSRNSADFQRLLEFCQVTDTLIADADGIYDLRDFNDQLLLGFKGTISAVELHILAQRMQEAKKAAARRDGQGRTLFSGVVRPGRMHDQTAGRTEGIAEQVHQHPTVDAEVDEGCRGLANEFPGQASAPPKKPKDDAPLGEHHAWRERRCRQSSARICVKHTNAECKQWRPLQRFTGRRETYAETHLAIAGLVSDRSAWRATRHKPNTELVLARRTSC